jgi:hypothetical protein
LNYIKLFKQTKVKIVENLDRTSTVREVKLVYATLAESMKFTGTEKKVSAAKKNITEGLFGEKFKKKIGSKGFLLPNTVEDGVDFVFDVVDKGGYPNYDQSNFDLVEDSKLSLTKEQVLDILRNSHDLHEFVPALKTQDELRQILDQHWYGISASSHDDIDQSSSSSLKSLTEGLSDDDDDIPMTFSSDKSLDEELDDILK